MTIKDNYNLKNQELNPKIKKLLNDQKKKIDLTKNIFQSKNGIYKKSKDKNDLIARIYINQITITKDKLELFEPVYSIKYHDILYDTQKTIENVTFDELIKKLETERLFLYDSKAIKSLFNEIFLNCYNTKNQGKEFIKT